MVNFLSGVSPFSTAVMKYFPLPVNETWRIPLINELLAIKTHNCELPGFTGKEIDDMLLYVCIS